MLPVSMVMGQSVSAGRLDDPKGKYQIKCLQPGRTLRLPLVGTVLEVDVGLLDVTGKANRCCRIPIAGKISTMVFDKTGTITKVLCISPWKL